MKCSRDNHFYDYPHFYLVIKNVFNKKNAYPIFNIKALTCIEFQRMYKRKYY